MWGIEPGQKEEPMNERKDNPSPSIIKCSVTWGPPGHHWGVLRVMAVSGEEGRHRGDGGAAGTGQAEGREPHRGLHGTWGLAWHP